jgi:hypothetical protein
MGTKTQGCAIVLLQWNLERSLKLEEGGKDEWDEWDERISG